MGKKCPVCDDAVYATEAFVVDGCTLHKSCFKCNHCSRRLTISNFAAVNKKFFCKTHYFEIFQKSGGTYAAFGDSGFKKKANNKVSSAAGSSQPLPATATTTTPSPSSVSVLERIKKLNEHSPLPAKCGVASSAPKGGSIAARVAALNESLSPSKPKERNAAPTRPRKGSATIAERMAALSRQGLSPSAEARKVQSELVKRMAALSKGPTAISFEANLKAENTPDGDDVKRAAQLSNAAILSRPILRTRTPRRVKKIHQRRALSGKIKASSPKASLATKTKAKERKSALKESARANVSSNETRGKPKESNAAARWEQFSYASCIAPFAAIAPLVVAAVFASDAIESSSRCEPMRMLGACLGAYYLVLVISRIAMLGPHYAFDVLWGCNVSLLLTAVGLLTGRPLLLGTSACVVCIDQLCWYADLIMYPVCGTFVVGVAKYLASPTTSRIHKITSTHHIWFLPLIWYAFYTWEVSTMPLRSQACSVVVTAYLAFAARAMTPFQVKEKTGSISYLNINLCYEFWKDVPIAPLHALDHAPAAVYLPWIVVLCNALNWVPCIALGAVLTATM